MKERQKGVILSEKLITAICLLMVEKQFVSDVPKITVNRNSKYRVNVESSNILKVFQIY